MSSDSSRHTEGLRHEYKTFAKSFILWRVKATTAEHDGDVIRVRITSPFIGRFRLDELERAPEKIEQWLRELEKNGYAFFSIRNAFRLVRRAQGAA
jgi:hypothetical protein